MKLHCHLFVLVAGCAVPAAADTVVTDPRSVVVIEGSSAGRAAPKRYWADYSGNAIRRSNPDGTQPEVVVSNAPEPYGISFDAVSGQLLWTSSGLEKVQAAPLGTTAATTLDSSFEEGFGMSRRSGDLDVGYGIADNAIVKITVNRTTGAETRAVLLDLTPPVPQAAEPPVHGLALSPDGATLYLGDEIGRMSRRMDVVTHTIDTLVFEDATPTPTATPTATPTPTLRPTPTVRARATVRPKPTLQPAPTGAQE